MINFLKTNKKMLMIVSVILAVVAFFTWPISIAEKLDGNDGYYAAINYLGDFVIYDFYRGSEKYSSYEFSQLDSINLVGNKLIVQKNNDELVTSINYVSGETEQLNLDVDIIFGEGKPYKDENGLYKYFANAYYIAEENNIKYISYYPHP